MSHKKPRIVFGKTLKVRSYVTFYYNLERVREYSGKCIGLAIFPNSAETLEERDELLELLRKELTLALKEGRYIRSVFKAPKPNKELTTREVLTEAFQRKQNSPLSDTHKRDLRYVFRDFMAFLTSDELKEPLDKIQTRRIDAFLSRYNTSGTYYMNKRTDLSSLFSTAAKIAGVKLSTVKDSEKRRAAAKLHAAYDHEQLAPILRFLKENHYSLYICCLLTYSCWLRPHVEIRALRKGHFKNDCSEIHLSGKENKGRQVRIVYVPEYMREDVKVMLEGLKEEENIFSRKVEPYNKDYFKTAWTRCKEEMGSLIRDDQTIYSFRHTAALGFYKRTKDVYRLQKLLSHKSIVTTMNYLRGLGGVDIQGLIDSAPTLDL